MSADVEVIEFFIENEEEEFVRLPEYVKLQSELETLKAENERLRKLNNTYLRVNEEDCEQWNALVPKLTEQNRLMREALEFIRGRESFRDLDETEIAREALAKCRKLSESDSKEVEE